MMDLTLFINIIIIIIIIIITINLIIFIIIIIIIIISTLIHSEEMNTHFKVIVWTTNPILEMITTIMLITTAR